MPKTAPYGSWKSPITSDLIVAQSITLSEVCLDSGKVYWLMRNLSPSTQETYIRAVAQFSTLHRRSPDKLGIEHLREYHLHLVSRAITANSICVKMAALRFFYGTTLRRPDIA